MSPQQKEYKNEMQQKRSAPPHWRCQGRVLGSGEKMKLNKNDLKLFYKISGALLFYTNQKYPVMKNLKEPTFENIPPIQVKNLYDVLSAHTELINSFVGENPFSFTLEELNIIKSWTNFIKDTFFIVIYSGAYTAFMTVSDNTKTYGVISLQDELRNAIPLSLPQYVDTILLPFKGKIIYCGYIDGHVIDINDNLKQALLKKYHIIRRKFGVITSLDEPTAKGVQK
ncbi:MAG TPA: hypothetical protein VFC41_08080 [Anaerovoracaceae bacterium]|nr:hypothetical protein [Anaerovoracaceae bacterium]